MAEPDFTVSHWNPMFRPSNSELRAQKAAKQETASEPTSSSEEASSEKAPAPLVFAFDKSLVTETTVTTPAPDAPNTEGGAIRTVEAAPVLSIPQDEPLTEELIKSDIAGHINAALTELSLEETPIDTQPPTTSTEQSDDVADLVTRAIDADPTTQDETLDHTPVTLPATTDSEEVDWLATNDNAAVNTASSFFNEISTQPVTTAPTEPSNNGFTTADKDQTPAAEIASSIVAEDNAAPSAHEDDFVSSLQEEKVEVTPSIEHSDELTKEITEEESLPTTEPLPNDELGSSLQDASETGLHADEKAASKDAFGPFEDSSNEDFFTSVSQPAGEVAPASTTQDSAPSLASNGEDILSLPEERVSKDEANSSAQSTFSPFEESNTKDDFFSSILQADVKADYTATTEDSSPSEQNDRDAGLSSTLPDRITQVDVTSSAQDSFSPFDEVESKDDFLTSISTPAPEVATLPELNSQQKPEAETVDERGPSVQESFSPFGEADDQNDFFAKISEPEEKLAQTTTAPSSFTPFEEIDGKDDFFTNLGSEKTESARADDPFKEIFSDDGEDEDLMLALAQKNKEKPKEPEVDIFAQILADDIEEELKSNNTKVDLSKSLAFLEEDELLPDDYNEPSRPSSVVNPSRATSAAHSAQPARQASNSYVPAPQKPPVASAPPKHHAQKPPSNAFDLPTDMVSKSSRRVSHAPNVSPYGSQPSQSPFSSPQRTSSITPGKPFFEELPLPERNTPRKSSSASNSGAPHHALYAGLNQPNPNYSSGPYGNLSSGVNSSLTSQSGLPLAPPNAPFAQRGHSRKSPTNSAYLPSSATPADNKPRNPYEPQTPAVNGLYGSPAPSQVQPSGGYNFPVTPNAYGPSQQQKPLHQSHYLPQYGNPAPGPANAYSSQNKYGQLQSSGQPRGMQPMRRTPSKGGFGELPPDIDQKQAEYSRSPEVQKALLNARHHRTPSNSHMRQNSYGGSQNAYNPAQAQQYGSYSRGPSGSAPSDATKPHVAPSQPVAPVNNEALLRRQFPIFHWGMGGKAVSVIPAAITFGGGATSTEVKVIHAKSIVKTDSLLSKFPFPLVTGKGVQRNKKKDLENWITEHVAALEKKTSQMPHEAASKFQSRILLWSIMLSLLKSDSTVTKPSVSLKESIRKILDPFVQVKDNDDHTSFAPAVDIYRKNMHRRTSSHSVTAGGQTVQSDDINKVVDLLKVGDRESALKYTLDHHLWTHALLIASSIGPQEWQEAVFEFVREEVRAFPSRSARDLALMYRIFSGAGADSGKYTLPLFFFFFH